MKLYTKDVTSVLLSLQTQSTTGLSQQEVDIRQKKFGPNSLPKAIHPSLFSIFIDQFKSPLIYLLAAAAGIIFLFGQDTLDAFIITGVLLFNSILGTVQEQSTHTIIESLEKMISADVIVVRDGKRHIVPDEQLVVGDIIILQEGQQVPADARVIESHELRVDEAVLTGEAHPVRKQQDALIGVHALADRSNMIYRGTYILSGSGKAVVVAIGLKTEIGMIHKTVEGISTDIPLRKELDYLSYIILLFIISICAALFVVGALAGKPLQELLVMLTALFICVVPEGLPVALTLILVAGAHRMAKVNVLVKNLQAVEALGRADVILVDKTGTLTRNEMMVSAAYVDHHFWVIDGAGYHAKGFMYKKDSSCKEELPVSEDIKKIAIACSLLNNTEIEYDAKNDNFLVKGDPTEAALYVFSQKVHIKRELLEAEYTLLYEIPFDQKNHYHAGFFEHKHGEKTEYIAFLVGAPETLINRSSFIDQKQKEGLAQLLEKGLRVVAVGYKVLQKEMLVLEESQSKQEQFAALVDQGISVLGFLGIEDAIRSDVAQSVADAKKAGLFTAMLTGDHQKTALQVAKAVGIYTEHDKALDGSELDALSDADLLQQLFKITVYSRCSPQHKMRIVNLFHTQKHIVAMTGDGINDAPSLVAADLGIAMGKIGTEVAKQAADLILLDDSFVTIVHAIEQGRHIFYSLKRVILYFFATNMGEILIVLFALAWGVITKIEYPLPLTAAQILWLNLVTDAFLDVSLSMEPQESGLLNKEWLLKKERLVDRGLIVKMFYMAFPMAICSLYAFLSIYQTDLPKARTVTLIMMAMFQWFNAWNCRSMHKSVFSIGVFTNKWFLLAASFVLSLQLFVVYVPWMQYIFKTVPLSFAEWSTIILISSTIFFAEELRKVVVLRIYRS